MCDRRATREVRMLPFAYLQMGNSDRPNRSLGAVFTGHLPHHEPRAMGNREITQELPMVPSGGTAGLAKPRRPGRVGNDRLTTMAGWSILPAMNCCYGCIAII